MIQLNENTIFWEADFPGVRKLSYGFINPDNMEFNERTIFVDNLAEYIKDHFDLKMYNKLHVKETNTYENQIFIEDQSKNLIMKNDYEQANFKTYIVRNKKSISHLRVYKITSNAPQDVAICNGFLVLFRKQFDDNKIANHISKLCEIFKFEVLNSDEYQPMFSEIIRAFPGTIIITDLGICADMRSYIEYPKGVSLIYSQNIYGNLAEL